MSERRQKINAVFFSLIMVLSMVAMSAVALGGSAAAAEQPEIEDPHDQEGMTGTTVTEGDLAVDNLRPETAPVSPGDEIDVAADVTNLGDEAETFEPRLTLDGQIISEQDDITLEAGDDTSIVFEDVAVPAPGEYTHAIVAGENAEASGDLIVGDLGDVETSGDVGAADILKVQTESFNFGPEQPFTESLADVNRDGEVRAADVLLTQTLSFGFEDGADPEVVDFDAPDQVTSGDEVTVSMTVSNSGDIGIWDYAEFRVGEDGAEDGDLIATEVADIGAMNTDRNEQTIEFTLDTTGLEGTFDHGIFLDGVSETASITIEGTADVDFGNQATASSTIAADGPTDAGVVADVSVAEESAVVVTYEDGDDLVIAGLETGVTEDGDVTIAVEDAGDFPGEHTAHVIPQDDLSEAYEPGDVVSEETVGAVAANDAATVFQGTLEFADQTFDEAVEEGDEVIELETADLLDGADDDTAFVVDVHPTDEDGELVASEFVGSTDVIAGGNEDVSVVAERVPDDGEFNEFPLTEDGGFVAMIHIVDDDAEPGDAASPGDYPVLTHNDVDGAVAGGVTDDAELTFDVEEPDVTAERTIEQDSVAPGEFFDVEVTIDIEEPTTLTLIETYDTEAAATFTDDPEINGERLATDVEVGDEDGVNIGVPAENIDEADTPGTVTFSYEVEVPEDSEVESFGYVAENSLVERGGQEIEITGDDSVTVESGNQASIAVPIAG